MYAYWGLAGMSKKSRLLGRNRFRRKDNIERYLKNQDNLRGFIWLMTMTNAGYVTSKANSRFSVKTMLHEVR